MNNVSFTGLRNIGGCTLYQTTLQQNIYEKQDYLIALLTDDYNGKDLTEFKNVAKLCRDKLGSCTNADDNRFLHIETKTLCNVENEYEKYVPKIFINGKEVPPSRSTIPMFSYIAKLTRRINGMKSEEFVYNQDFKYGTAGRTSLVPDYDLGDIVRNFKWKLSEFIEKIYSADSSCCTAKVVNDNISEIMMDYFK